MANTMVNWETLPREQKLGKKGLADLIKKEGIDHYEMYSSAVSGLDAHLSDIKSLYAPVQVSGHPLPLYARLKIKMENGFGKVVSGDMIDTYLMDMPGFGIVPITPDYNKY